MASSRAFGSLSFSIGVGLLVKEAGFQNSVCVPALLLYFAVVVNSRRQELVLENYWANKHMLQHAKTQYYYV
ncbi:hypothetical protein HF086_003841 [Spodoptera exigua]|uniref:Uncharacterized protein n=1 Tax=Spodoptera exigua TaxID=7107 RepID=A0A922MXY4_SPOEX|nr:hypothetical protein HF086_003841 [Spodoptera exigua]